MTLRDMTYNENRLRFVHCNTIFATREDAIAHVTDIHNIERPALYAEPMVLRYGDKSNPNIILAIGSYGDGVTSSMKNKTFFIDSAKMESDIEDMAKSLSIVEKDMDSLKTLVANMISACGLNEKGEYVVNEDNAILSNATSLYDAESKLADYLLSVEKKLTLSGKESNNMKLDVAITENGTTIEGNVKLAEKKIVDGKVIKNILREEEGGLYTNVDVDFDMEEDKLIFSVNGERKEFQFPHEVYITGGKYDTETESLVLNLNREALVDGKMSDKLIIDMRDLIGEWDVLGENSKTPIVLTKEKQLSEEVLHGSAKYQDILKADVRIASTEIYPDNILKKDPTGEYLIVDGKASNISYWKDGKKITVKEALDNVKCNIAEDSGNIIKEKATGLYANVDVEYDAARNVIVFNNGIVNKELKLASAEIIDDVTYNKVKEVIEIRFKLADGTIKKIEIPVGDIITEWEVDNTNATVTLNRVRSTEGTDKLTANVNIADIDDNILKINGHALYVKGDASNIKYKETTVAEELDNIKNDFASADEALNSKILTEAETARKAEQANKDAINSESNRAQQAENELRNSVTENKKLSESNKEAIVEIVKINESQDNRIQSVEAGVESAMTAADSVLSIAQEAKDIAVSNAEKVTLATSSIESEIERAKTAETELDSKIADNKSKVEKAQTDIAAINVNLSSEIERALGAEQDLKTRVDAVQIKADNNAVAITNEIDRAKSAEKVNSDKIAQLQTSITEEISRAQGVEANLQIQVTTNANEIAKLEGGVEIAGSIQQTVSHAMSDVKEFANEKIEAEKARAESVEKVLDDKISALNTKSEDYLAEAKSYTDEKVQLEKERAIAKEDAISTEITSIKAKDAEQDEALSKKIENVEVRKNSASDLQYTLYVDGVAAGDINIPEDQFLKSVSYDDVSKKLTFDFKTEEGDKQIAISVADLVDTYTNGNGISLEANKFSLKLDTATESFLTLGVDGLKLSGVQTAIDSAVDVEHDRAVSKEIELQESILKEVSDRSIADTKTLESAKVYADNLNDAIDSRVKTLESDMSVINGNEATEGSIAKSLKDAKSYTDSAVLNEKTERVVSDNNLKAEIETKANKSDVYTKAEIDAKGFITEHQDISNLATKAELESEKNARIAKDEAQDVEIAKKIEKVEVKKNSQSDLQYTLYVDSIPVGEINIPKDQFLKGVEYNQASKELEFSFETSTGTSLVKVDVSDLVDTYTNGNGIALEGNKFSIKLDTASESFLTLGVDGIRLSGVQDAINASKASALNDAKTYTDSKVDVVSQKIDAQTVKIDEQSDKIDSIKQSVDTISATDGREGSLSKVLSDSKAYTDEKVAENATKIQTVSGEVQSLKFYTENSDTIEMSIVDVDGVRKLVSNMKLSTENGNILEKKVDGLYADVDVAYNAATNVLTINGTDITLSEHSLVSNGYYDSDSKSIVLEMTTASGNKQIKINVKDLVNDFRIVNKSDSPVKLSDSIGTDGVREVSASLNIANIDRNLLTLSSNTLYASSMAEDHLIFDESAGGYVNLASFVKKIQSSASTITGTTQEIIQIKDSLTEVNTKVSALELNYNSVNESVRRIETSVDNALDTSNSAMTAASDAVAIANNAYDKVANLKDNVDANASSITAINEAIGDYNVQVQGSISENLSKIKSTLGILGYDESKGSVSARLDAIEDEIIAADYGSY